MGEENIVIEKEIYRQVHEKKFPWIYVIFAAICAVVILGGLHTLGIFSGLAADTTITTTSAFGSGFSPPAETNSGLVITDKKDDEKSTKTTKIPSPNEITQYGFIDISNPPEFIQANVPSFVFTDIEISNNKITAAFLSVDKTQSHRIRLVRIIFFDAEQNRMSREQQRCRYYDFEYKMGDAYCQWPEDYCGLTWEEYWKGQGRTAKSAIEDVVPRINAGEKYTFSINNCPIPNEAKYALITTISR